LIKGNDASVTTTTLPLAALIGGFLAAFVFGVLACKWMIDIVKKGKLIYFAYYCSVVGSIAIVYALFM
jgi:undecaprenyl-diphosphatase